MKAGNSAKRHWLSNLMPSNSLLNRCFESLKLYINEKTFRNRHVMWQVEFRSLRTVRKRVLYV